MEEYQSRARSKEFLSEKVEMEIKNLPLKKKRKEFNF